MSKLCIKQLTVGMAGTNCYFVYQEVSRETIIIDPGDDAEEIIKKCEEASLQPVAIYLTHGHFDHIMAAPELKKQYEIPIYAGEDEKVILEDAHNNLSADWIRRPLAIQADVYLKEGDLVKEGGLTARVIATPGHTVGGVSYYFEEEGVLFSGDTLFHDSYGRTDLPTGDTGALIQSIARLLMLPEEVMVYPGHMDSTTIEHEKKFNPAAGGYR